jgi:hypothetical protein
MGKMSLAGVLRLRAAMALSRDKSVKRSAQDDDFAASWRREKRAPFRTSVVRQTS